MTDATTIPSPSDADRVQDLIELYSRWDDGLAGWDDEILGTIRRCHAAETALAAKDAVIAELREALRPFAAEADAMADGPIPNVVGGYQVFPDAFPLLWPRDVSVVQSGLELRHLRNAAAILARIAPTEAAS